jgi:hypothetical protein
VENDKYPIDKEHKYADDFIFCVALFVFCFVLDKISQFVIKERTETVFHQLRNVDERLYFGWTLIIASSTLINRTNIIHMSTSMSRRCIIFKIIAFEHFENQNIKS